MSATDDVQEGEPSRAELLAESDVLGREREEESTFDIVDPDGAMEDWNRVVAMFTYHKPTEDQVARMELLRIHARVLMREIFGCCPASPDKAAAVKKLREAIMWANVSIVLEGKL